MATSIKTTATVDSNSKTISSSQKYIDSLSEKLNEAKRQFNADTQAANDAYEDFAIAYQWYRQIGQYKKNIEKTDRIANVVLTALESATNQSALVGTNTALNADAIKILVRHVHEMVEMTEAAKKLVKGMINKIDLINDPNLNPNESVMLLLANLNNTLDEAIAATQQSFTETVNLIKNAQKLNALLQGEFGLTENLKNMGRTIRVGEDTELDDDLLRALGRRPTFPLDDMDRDYYDRIQLLFTQSEDEVKNGVDGNKKDLFDKTRAKQIVSQAHYNAINNALNAALVAKNG